jgi:hypothetical protein
MTDLIGNDSPIANPIVKSPADNWTIANSLWTMTTDNDRDGKGQTGFLANRTD